MTKNPNTPLLNTTALLELSMSIGQYKDFEKNAQTFTSCLKQLLHLTSCEIWYRENNEERIFHKIHKNNRNIIRSSIFEHNLEIAKFKKTHFSHSTVITSKDKGVFKGFTNLEKGIVYRFKLSDTAILIAYDSKTQTPSPIHTFDFLEPIFQRFYVSLEQSYLAEKINKLEAGILDSKEELQKFKLVLDNISEGLIIFNRDLEAVFVNDRITELSEYPREEIIGKHISNLTIDKETLPSIISMFQLTLGGKSFKDQTIELVKKESKDIWWVTGTLSPYKNSADEIVGAIVIIRDITAEKLAREAATEIQSRYDLLINHGFDGVLVYDLKHKKMLSVNDTLLKNFGFTRDEFLNIKVQDAAPKKQSNDLSSSEYLDQINQLIKTKGKHSYEWTHKRKDGSIFYVEIVAVRLLAPNEHIKIEIHKDITERYLAQKAIKENELRLSRLFELSPVPILIRSIHSLQFKQVNQKFTELFGYTLDEINSKDRNSLVHWEDTKLIHSNMKKLISGEISSFKLEKQYIRKDGSIFWGAATRSIIEIEGDFLLIGFIGDITERKKALADLERSEAKVRSIFDSTSDKIIALDRNLCLVDFNKSAAKFMKDFYSDKNLQLGDKFAPTNPQTGQSWTSFYKRALEGESLTVTREYNLYNKEKVDLINILPMKDDQQNIIGISLYGKDITALNSAQKALQKNEHQLREAQRIAKTGNWEFEIESNKLAWSQGTMRIFGFSPNAPIPSYKEYKKMVHPEDLQDLIESVEHNLAEGFSFEFELRHYTISKKLIYVILKGETFMKDGQPFKIFGTIQDITDLKNVELKLIEFNKKYQDLFDNMYDALLVTNYEGYFIDANLAGQRLLEYSLDELKKIKVPDIVHPDDKEESKAYFKKLMTEGFYSNYQGRIITKSGKVKYLQVNSNAIIENGKMIGSRDIARDITDLKEVEKKREQLYTKLENVNKELKDFAYIVSHDLKAPLRAISSLSSWIAEDYKDLFDEEGKKHLELLTGRANRMQNFIEGILQYSRIGRIQLKRTQVNIQNLLATVIDSLAPPSNFIIKIDQQIPFIECEEIRIQQVFQNLISNAIKYNDKTKGIIEIKYKDLGNLHEFSVSDNGPGINEKHFDKIFKIFQTLQSRDRLESTGIGLTIVKRIVELHGGKIKLNSILGEGTKFSFTILK